MLVCFHWLFVLSVSGSNSRLAPETTAAQSTPLTVRSAEVVPTISWGDFDGDNRADMYAIYASGAERLLRNNGDGTFVDVTARAGLSGLVESRAARWADFDSDGKLDLYLVSGRETQRLFKNDGDGRFTDVTLSAGLLITGGEIDAAWLDFDRDGAPDLAVRTTAGDLLFHNTKRGMFDAVPLGLPSASTQPTTLAAGQPAPGLPDAAAIDQSGTFGAEPKDASTAQDRIPRSVPTHSADVSGASTSSTVLPPVGGSGSVIPLGSSAVPTMPVIVCASGVIDQATSNCLEASSTPTLGRLYPLSSSLFVDTNGTVGVGTASPIAPLTVYGYTNSIAGVGRTLELESFAPNVLFHETQTDNHYRIALYNGSQNLYFERFNGSGLNYVADMVIKNGDLGLGTTAPTHKLTVTGVVRSTTGGFMFPDGSTQTSAAPTGPQPWLTNGNDIYCANVGGVGVGWPAPSHKLHVRGNVFLEQPGLPLVGMGDASLPGVINGPSSGGPGIVTSYAPDGDPIASFDHVITATGQATNRAFVGVLRNHTYLAGMYVDANETSSTLFATVKNFRAPNPNDPNTEIWYACVEGPEAAAYIRGTGHLVGGEAYIRLPDHFQSVSVSEGMTVQLTPCSSNSKGLAVTKQNTQGFAVRELLGGTGDYDFHWRVECVRKGQEHYRVIRARSEVLGSASGG